MTTLELAFAWMFGTLFVSATVFLALEWVFDWVSNRRLTQRLLCFFNLHHGHLVIEERVSRYECQYCGDTWGEVQSNRPQPSDS